MTEPTITYTVKEAEALEAELAALTEANAKLSAELATAKTAAEKTAGIDKIAGDVAAVLAEQKMVSADKVAQTKEALAKEGGIAAYFKKACELYRTSEAARKEAEAKLKEVPTRVGRVTESEKKAGTVEVPVNAVQAASDKFAQRVLSAAG